MSRTEYAYTTGDLTGIAPTATFAYTYGSNWKDQLVSFNGQSIAYDQAGNPTSYRGASLSWTRGRLLASYKASGAVASTILAYDANGVRTRKVVPGTNHSTTTEFLYSGNNLLQEKVTVGVAGQSSTTYRAYIYNSQGIIGFVQGGNTYSYRKNLFGDIVAIYQGATKVAEYIYDAWGNHKVLDGNSVEVTDPTHIAHQNPFRYRGYYFDTDLGLYYLMSRYYDPQTGRFIQSADVSSIDASIIDGLNLYDYALNNPIAYKNVASNENAEASECITNALSHISNGNDPSYAISIPCPAVPSELKHISKLNEIFTTTAHVFIVSKYLLGNLAFLDEMRLFGRNPAKVLGTLPRAAWINKLGYVFAAINAGITIYDNLQQGNSFEHALLDGALTFGINAASAWVGGFVGSNVGGWIGSFLGSLIPIPYVGPLIGFVLGTCIGLAVAWFVDDVLNRLKDDLLDLLFE